MNQAIHLATATGVSTAPLFATFDEVIEGTWYTFGVHGNLSCSLHHKLSEFSTGMGIAELNELVVSQGQETAGASYDDLVHYGRQALKSVIDQHGNDSVVEILTRNQVTRPLLNTELLQ